MKTNMKRLLEWGSDISESSHRYIEREIAMSLHERIAKVLGWKVEDTYGFSLLALREMVRGSGNDKLVYIISEAIRTGSHIYREE